MNFKSCGHNRPSFRPECPLKEQYTTIPSFITLKQGHFLPRVKDESKNDDIGFIYICFFLLIQDEGACRIITDNWRDTYLRPDEPIGSSYQWLQTRHASYECLLHDPYQSNLFLRQQSLCWKALLKTRQLELLQGK